jgi:4-amino-4-deoxy-L-arabinose transferase-like glycosyltransferase
MCADAKQTTGSLVERRTQSNQAERPFRETSYGWRAFGVAWLVCAFYTGSFLRQGWIPYDAGSLAQMANRVLQGQAPYRDFGEIYTGGQTYLNALAMHLFGLNFFSMRIMMFLFFLAWVPAVYFIARRFVTPLTAAAVTLLAVAWSVPNYAEAMPSWYNLFFTTWGVLALMRYVETDRQRWLWAGGLCGGLSFLIKITGLYFIAGALLFFVFREQQNARGNSKAAPQGGLLYRLFVVLCLLLFVALVVHIVAERPTFDEFFHFVIPGAALAAFLLWEVLREPSCRSAPRFRLLFEMCLPFLGGLLIPAGLFFLWFAHEGALTAWIEGVFLEGTAHTHWAAFPPVSVYGLAGLLPAALVVALACDGVEGNRALARYGCPVLLGSLLLAAWKWVGMFRLIGFSVQLVVPCITLAVPFVFRIAPPETGKRRQLIFLVASVTAVWAMVQYPRSAINYFYYVAPLAALSLAALFSMHKTVDRVALGSLLAFYLVFAVWLHPPAFFAVRQLDHGEPMHLQTINLPRAGGIRAPAKLAAEYDTVIRLVQEHAHGPYIYATPDCPEIYFLSGHLNPTPTIIDFLDSDFFNVAGRTERIFATIEDHSVNVAVINSLGTQSGQIPAGLRAILDHRFPESREVGSFEVRWKQ